VIDYSWIRRRIVLLGEDLVSYNPRSIDGPVVIVLDSTGVKVCKSGSWLERRGIEPIIRPRRDARTDRGPPSRRSAARMIRDYGYRAWSRIVGYGGRWMAETAISRLKALFGEHLLSRKPRWMDSEPTTKALIHNMLLSAVTT
jgi:hypothetical protein